MHQNDLDTTYHLRIGNDRLDALAEIADAQGVPMSEFIRGAFEYLIENPQLAQQIRPVRGKAPGRPRKQRQAEQVVV